RRLSCAKRLLETGLGLRTPVEIISPSGAELGHEGEARGGSVPGVLDRRATKPSWASAVPGGEIISTGVLSLIDRLVPGLVDELLEALAQLRGAAALEHDGA